MNRVADTSIVVLIGAVCLLAIVATTVGLFWPFPVIDVRTLTSFRGEEITLFGTGLYRHETSLLGAGFVGQDWVTLCLATPLLIIAAARTRVPGPSSDVLLLAVLSYFLYAYATFAVGAQFNVLFLVYVGLFSASLFGVILVGRRLVAELNELTAVQWARLPRRAPSMLLLGAGVATAAIWLVPLMPPLVSGGYPSTLGHRTTSVTDALDLAVIVPSAILAAWLVWRGAATGYAMAAALLGIITMLLPTILAGTVVQMWAGVVFTLPEIVGPIGGFLAIGTLGAWALASIAQALPRPSR